MRTPQLMAACLAGVLLAACTGGGKQNDAGYVNNGDTGAAAPATQQTLSPNPGMGQPNPGVQEGTGRSMVAGDSGRPSLTAGQSGREGVNPVPRTPVTGESTGAARRVPNQIPPRTP